MKRIGYNLTVYRSLVVSFERVSRLSKLEIKRHPFGSDGGGEPHVPIPNTTD